MYVGNETKKEPNVDARSMNIFFLKEKQIKKDKKIQFHRQINHTIPLDRPSLCLFDFSHGHDPVLSSKVSRSLPGPSQNKHSW
jgi:hypothetical protein